MVKLLHVKLKKYFFALYYVIHKTIINFKY